MTERRVSRDGQRAARGRGITQVIVRGFKSLIDETVLDIRPLTILAGANSSGKSSAMQPLLMLKQTLDAAYDPGPLLLSGPHVSFTSSEQMLAKRAGAVRPFEFEFGVQLDGAALVRNRYVRRPRSGVQLVQTSYRNGEMNLDLRSDMDEEAIRAVLPADAVTAVGRITGGVAYELYVDRFRCLLTVSARPADRRASSYPLLWLNQVPFESYIESVIHVPGLRGNPERNYKTTAVGGSYPGTFEAYAASVVSRWQEERDPNLAALGEHLRRLGLTWKVAAKRIDETQVELRVGRLCRLKQGGARDTVSIADVGFGVSQTLPVVVALLAAGPGQLVYLEQPEIHLHPRAQFAMAELLAEAAGRGVRVVAETHSALLLLGVQALVAQGALSRKIVKLHWFQRHEDGGTTVTSGEVDDAGAFGNWPEDFGDTTLAAEKSYLDLAEARIARG